MPADVSDKVRSLADLGLEDLRVEWRSLYGAPPKLRSPDLLRHILAWRIQAEAAGGLDAASVALLKRKAARRGHGLAQGTVLTREWRGVRHEAQIVEGGVMYAGEPFSSLSRVARHITGSRWNGPRFFGLREAGP